MTIHLFMERHSSAVGAAVSMQFIRHNWRSSSKIRKLDLSLNYNVCLAKLVETRQSLASSTEHCPVSWPSGAVAPCYPLDEAPAEVRLLNQSVTFPDLTWAHGRVGLTRGEGYSPQGSFTPTQQWRDVPVVPRPMHLFGSMLPMCILILISHVSARKQHTPLLAGCPRCLQTAGFILLQSTTLKTHNAHMAEH